MKPIIPLFSDIEFVPPILRPNVGCRFDGFNVKEKIKEIILKTIKK